MSRSPVTFDSSLLLMAFITPGESSVPWFGPKEQEKAKLARAKRRRHNRQVYATIALPWFPADGALGVQGRPLHKPVALPHLDDTVSRIQECLSPRPRAVK